MPNECTSITIVKIDGFNKDNPSHQLFLEELVDATKQRRLLSLIAPQDGDDVYKAPVWGTKWDLMSADVLNVNSEVGEFEVEYTTAHSAPIEAFKYAVARGGMWSMLQFHTMYYEEGERFAGEACIVNDTDRCKDVSFDLDDIMMSDEASEDLKDYVQCNCFYNEDEIEEF